MKRLYLASEISETAGDIAKDIGSPQNKKLAFIYTAHEHETPEPTWLKKDREGFFNAGFGIFDYTITGKSSKDFDRDLGEADVIHVNGGNSFYLLYQAQISGFDKWIRKAVDKGKIYTSSSAGSIVASQKIPDYLVDRKQTKQLKNLIGFRFVDFIVLPHWGRPDFREKYLKTRLKNIYRDNTPPLVLISDYQYIKVVDDMYKIVDVRD